MTAIVVLADDLTGAAGTAALFADRGAPAAVSLRGQEVAGAQVVACDLATRDHAAPHPSILQSAAAAAFAAGTALVAKRIDSTLRGHVAAEVGAVLAAAPSGTLALVSPAFPSLGRTVRDGRLAVNGAVTVNLTDVLGNTLPMTVLGLAAVRHGEAARLLRRYGAGGRCVVLCDAETEDDLAAIAVAAAPLDVVPCDPGPLTVALAVARGLVEARSQPLLPPAVRLPLLAVIGSRSPLSHRQIALAETEGLLAPAPVTGDPAGDTRALEVALAAGRPAVALIAHYAERDATAAAGALAAAAREALGITSAGGLYLSGGHTARAVLDALSVDELVATGSLLPLTAVSAVAGGPLAGLTVVTKGGLVGDDQMLARCIRSLTDASD